MAILKYTEDGTVWQELLAGPKGDQGVKGDKGDPGADSTVPGPPGPTEVVVTHPNGTDVLVVAGGQTVHYDSGWRDVSGILANGWTGGLVLRRINGTITFQANGLDGTASTSRTVLANLPAGFRAAAVPGSVAYGNVVLAAGVLVEPALIGAGFCLDTADRKVSAWCGIIIPCDSPTPTSLPGTAHSAAPA